MSLEAGLISGMAVVIVACLVGIWMEAKTQRRHLKALHALMEAIRQRTGNEAGYREAVEPVLAQQWTLIRGMQEDMRHSTAMMATMRIAADDPGSRPAFVGANAGGVTVPTTPGQQWEAERVAYQQEQDRAANPLSPDDVPDDALFDIAPGTIDNEFSLDELPERREEMA